MAVLLPAGLKGGVTPDAMDLAASGAVDPETIVARSALLGHRAAGMWYGLAAEASLARGDRFGVLRFLQKATDSKTLELAWASIAAIREKADDELHESLDKLGIPRL